MSVKVLNTINELVENEDIFYLASGKLNQNILQSMVATIGYGSYNNSTNKEYDDAKIDSLITVAIEMVQNVSKYKKEIENYYHDLVIITLKDNITISTSNLANRQNKDNLVKTLDFLKSLDAQGLREYLKESIRAIPIWSTLYL